jgi:hypothetical protein
MLILDGFCPNKFYRRAEKLSVWQSAAAFGGQKLPKAETNRPFVTCLEADAYQLVHVFKSI